LIKEAIGYGNDITEAQEDARKNLGVSALEDVQFEIISQSKKKVLGLFGGAKAEVRAYIEIPDAPKKAPKKEKASKPQPKKENQKKTEEKPTAKAEPKKVTTVAEDFANMVDSSLIDADSKLGRAISYLKVILASFDCTDVKISAAEKENCAYIAIEGENVGAIIGRRGETLDALQYLAGLAANNNGGYYKVSLNIGDYREKRESALIELAGKVAKQVLETGRSRALEPMNPYERRIIHTAIQEIEGVVSNSIGEGQNRRVVVYSENGDSRPPRITNDRRNGRGRNGRGRQSRPSNTVATTPSREPKKDSDMPLYGKIN